jgi:hypothetical protein
MTYYDAMTRESTTATADVESLRQQVAAQLQTIAAHEAGLTARDLEIQRKQRLIDALSAEIARLKWLPFAAKTEALSALQRSLFGEAVEEDLGAVEQQLQDAASTPQLDTPIARPAKASPKRAALPEHPKFRTSQSRIDRPEVAPPCGINRLRASHPRKIEIAVVSRHGRFCTS